MFAKDAKKEAKKDEEKKSKLTFRAEELAVPEVYTGELPAEDELPQDETAIQYDTLAIPEIHLENKHNK